MSDYIVGDGDKLIIRTTGDDRVEIPLSVNVQAKSDLASMVPSLWQRDPIWKDKRLGHSYKTIGGYGCVVTSIASILVYYGFGETPETVNEWAKHHNGFYNGNLFIWESVIRGWPPIHLVKRVDCPHVPAPIDEINLYLDAGKPVIAYADFDHNPTNGLQTHFFVIVARNGEKDYLICDPWHGDVRSLVETYGRDDLRRPWLKYHHGIIQGVRFYSD